MRNNIYNIYNIYKNLKQNDKKIYMLWQYFYDLILHNYNIHLITIKIPFYNLFNNIFNQ
jgi:hypothetical protein